MKGKASRCLNVGEMAEVKAAIARGKQLVKVEREIAKVTTKLDVIAAQVQRLGLVVPGR